MHMSFAICESPEVSQTSIYFIGTPSIYISVESLHLGKVSSSTKTEFSAVETGLLRTSPTKKDEARSEQVPFSRLKDVTGSATAEAMSSW